MNLTDKRSAIEESVYLWRDNKNSITRSEGILNNTVGSIDYILAVIDALNFLEEKGKDIASYIHYIIPFY